jgi:hypothetical protein
VDRHRHRWLLCQSARDAGTVKEDLSATASEVSEFSGD